MNDARLSSRNAAIAAMLADGVQLKSYYRFIALNPHINLRDACHILLARPNATICYPYEEWNEFGRQVKRGAKCIAYYDYDGYIQYVFDMSDTRGENLLNSVLPIDHLLTGLDELNGPEAQGADDYSKILHGVKLYLHEQGILSGKEERDELLTGGVAYSLYVKSGASDSEISFKGLPFSYQENAELVKEVYVQTEMLVQEIEVAYKSKQEEVNVIDDTDEETVSDEPIISDEQLEDRQKNIITFSQAVAMYDKPYVILTDYKKIDGKEETHIYIGKQENFDEATNGYDNSDESLIYATDRPQMLYLLYGKPYAQTQQELIENGTFTAEDYAEYDKLKHGSLSHILQNQALKFGVRQDTESSGIEFRYPNWQDEPKHPAYPMYKQYKEFQAEKPNAVVLYRYGDFYEAFDESAKLFSKELDLTLTGRDVGLKERIPMCGIPYHALDKYLDKILKNHGVYLVDTEEEPIYILSHEEALEQSVQPKEKKKPVLTEITDSEPSPFDAEQVDDEDWRNELAGELGEIVDEQSDEEAEGADELDESEETDEEDEDSKQEEEPKVKDKKESTPKKPEKGIKDRKRKDKPQPTLFDLAEPQEKSRKEKWIEYELKRGSHVADGKFRIFDKYNENPSEKAFAEFLKKEYGIGGSYIDNTSENHNAKGISLRLVDREHPEENLEVSLKWSEVATRIADLIDDDNYFDEQEKKKYVEYKVEQNKLREQRKEEERQKTELINRFICSAPDDRKQRVFDEYAKTTKLITFSEFLKNEYGTGEEQGDGYYVTHNAQGIWLNKGEKTYDYQKLTFLKWEEFADRVCTVIEHDNYIEAEPPREYKLNSFTELSDEDRAYFENYNSRYRSEPTMSPWDEVESCRTIANGIYEVSTAGHGGVMIDADLAAHILSAEALAVGFANGNYLCFEEDCDACVPLRELYDKSILTKTHDYFTHYFVNSNRAEAENGCVPFIKATEAEKVEYFKWWNNAINESLEEWNPKYWQAREQAKLSEAELSTEQKIKIIVDGIVKEGTEKTTDGNWVAYFEDYKDNEQFVREHHHEISEALVKRQEVAEVGVDDIGIDARFNLEYCPNYDWNADEEKNEDKQAHEEEKGTRLSVGDKYIYKNREVTVKELSGINPDEAVIEYEQKLGELAYAVTQNINVSELIKNGVKVKDEAAENTDLNGVLDQSGLGGAKTRFRNNVAAIKLVNKLYAENRNPTESEKKVLAQFVGWGGLSQAFDENNADWQKEYAELKTLLSQEDYEQARSSTLNAYYTAKDVIGGIYAALNRFGVKGNNRILEPSMGTGNFFGYMPKEIAEGARLYGVELDNLTGRIATKLYPQASVQIKGFEDTSFPNNKFDIVVGNVPFGGYGVADSDYNKYNFKVHDYFLAKSIDKVKPNGIVAIVTSKGTMDKLNQSARKYVAERAELLGAIRLPNTAFKQTAGTEAVADILFFKKREERIATDEKDTEWLKTGKTHEGYEINQYFIEHPEMVLGTLVEETGLYGGVDTTVKPDGRELSEALAEAVSRLPQDVYVNPDKAPEEDLAKPEDYSVKPFCFKAVNGKLYMRVGDEMQEQEIPKFPKDAYSRIEGMIELREEFHHVLEMQSNGCSDEVLQREQGKLNRLYDLFVRRYGNLNSQTNIRLFKEDGDSALLFACEDVDEETKAITKADVFSKRTIRPYVVPTNTDDCFEALQISKNERGRVDISYIEELTGKSYDDVLFELGDSVFRDPVKVDKDDRYSGFVTSEEYLSGFVKDKLRTAKRYALDYPEYQRNVTALEQVQPTPLNASEIAVRLGQTWVDKKYYEQFYRELVKVPWYMEDAVEIYYNPHDSSWRLDQKENVRYQTQMRQKQVYGTPRAPAYRLFIDSMNLRPTTIYDTVKDEDGRERRVLNQAETIAAREKQNKIKEEFANWIFADPERREELVETYNRLFNRIKLPSYDGSYLRFPEMTPAIELKPHQKNAIHRIITSNDSTLLHHVVGSGKTYTMIASIMKMRQLGLCKKAMVAVPNHLVQQWASEWHKLYPNAKILVASKEDLEKNNRRRFVSKVAMGDWDGIIIAQSSFAKIPVSQERQIVKLNEEIASVEQTIQNQWEEKGMPRGAVKNLERIKKTKKAQLKKLMDDKDKDSVLTFENLGVDYLYIDEAHYYKNLFLFSKMTNVAGISNAASQRASDLKLKCEYLQEKHDSDRGVVFATGTPISNSMTEMYTMQTYLQPSVLKDTKMSFFDGWAADFGETITSMELAPSGQGYRARTRFAKFTNLPELLKMYRSFADVQTADMVKLNVPEAERKVITLKPSQTVVNLAEEIADRAEKIYGGGVDSRIDNMLKVTSDGKKLALDPRCYVPMSADEPNNKINEAVQYIRDIWEDTADKKGTQIVFCDLSTPKRKFEDYEYGEHFDAYNEIKYKLVQMGIPAHEIAFIHDANTDEQKQSLFDSVNSGAVRVLIGSTEKCGAGTNVQKRLVALHHMDTPYRPSDLAQREGRIIRQGNTNEKVQIFTYVTERTFDSYSYQILENKQRFISQIDRGDLTVREAEDIDETTLSYAEIKAITAANPKIKRKMEVDTEIARLRVLEGQYRKNLYELQDRIRKNFPENIRQQELLIERAELDLAHYESNKPTNPDEFKISVLGTEYTDKKEGGKALMEALLSSKPESVVAEYCGFKISMNPFTSLVGEREITIAANGHYTVSLGDSVSGNLQRIDNFFNDLPARKTRLENTLTHMQEDMAIAQEQVKKPFEQAEQLSELLSEQTQLNAELNIEKTPESVVIDDEGDGEGEDNYRILPTEKDIREVKIIDQEERGAATKIAVLPDYTVTTEEMHEYGYKGEGMLPLSRKKALRFWLMGLKINKLNADDSSKEAKYEDFAERGKLYGIEMPVWKNFLQHKTSVSYLIARLHATSAAYEMISKEMSDIDDKFIGKFKEDNFRERVALEDFLPYREASNKGYVKTELYFALDEFTDRIWREELKMYGWAKEDIPKSIAEYIADESLKDYAKSVAHNSFNKKTELINILNRFTDEEIEDMNLPAFDDELTVVSKEPSIYLDDEGKTFLPGLLAFKNEVTGDYYVMNDTSPRNRNGSELEVGDKTDVETVLAYNGLYDGNPLKEFHTEAEAKAYYREKVNEIRVVATNSTDIRQAVKNSALVEFAKFREDMLKLTPDEVFMNNYKIYCFNELGAVIDDDEYSLSDDDYKALYRERGHILESLYDEFISSDDYNLENYDDKVAFIKSYCEYYHGDIYNNKPIYFNTLEYAEKHDEMEKYNESHDISFNCKTAIETNISKSYDGMHLKSGFEDEIINKYGKERVNYILATTIREHADDGRFSRENKEWAKSIPVSESEDERRMCCLNNVHPAVLDGFTDIIRKKIKENQEETKIMAQEKTSNNESNVKERNWIFAHVAKDALVAKHEYSSFFRLPTYSEYAGYGYSIFNNRYKEGRQIADLQSDTRELCYDIRLADDEEIVLKHSNKDDVILTAREFMELVSGTTSKDYAPKPRVEVNIPKEAKRNVYDNSTMFVLPDSVAEDKFTYFIPNRYITNGTGENEGRIILSIPEDFEIKAQNKDEEEKTYSLQEFKALCNNTVADDYKVEENADGEAEENSTWHYVTLDKAAKVAEYEKSTLFKMPKGEFEGYTYYIPNGFVHEDEEKGTIRIGLPEDFVVKFKDGKSGDEISMTAEEYAGNVRNKKLSAYRYFQKPSDEAKAQFEKVEERLRANLPVEMLQRANWVAITTFEKENGKLGKRPIDCNTGKYASDSNAATWADFDTACKFARENGLVTLAYALDGEDNICCIDLDGCMQENGDFSELAQKTFNLGNGTYSERSVSGKGLHVFGKTDDKLDLRSFSKNGDMEFYRRARFIAVTGDYYGSSELKSFDTPEMQGLLTSKFEKRPEIKNAGRGVEGFSTMSDREVYDRACYAYGGQKFKDLFDGKDLQNNHSNSDMSLMNLLAFWCNGDKDQMMRMFAASGLYRPEKSAEYYECTMLKALQGTTDRYNPKPKVENKKPSSGNGSGNNGKR
ncbi:MAG: DUF3849 domain-containing protein [Roseburia sp.]|nr:DUF3849 domain-containing protein [Roseburia sp.]